MNCPYCGKRTKDMPNHLDKNKMCAESHHVNLRGQFIDVVRVTLAQQPLSGSPKGSPKSAEPTSDNSKPLYAMPRFFSNCRPGQRAAVVAARKEKQHEF